MYYLKFISLLLSIFSLSSCEVTEEEKAKLLSEFINIHNNRPNVGHRASNGVLPSVKDTKQWYGTPASTDSQDKTKKYKHAFGDDEIQIKGHEDVRSRKLDILTINDIEGNRLKRQVLRFGEEVEQNPDDPIYKQLAEEALQKYVLDSADKEPHTLLNVKRVTTQVVAGFLTRIDFLAAPNYNPEGLLKKCFSKIWERPPGLKHNRKEINVTCVILLKRPGGENEQNPEDPIFQQLAKESLQKYVLNSVDKEPHTLLRVERVTTQVVKGFVTRINFLAVPNDNPEHLVKNCFSEIWEPPSGPGVFKKHINVSCVIGHHMLKRQVRTRLGGWVDQDPDDPTYQQLAKESLQKYVLDRVDKKPHRLLRVERVATQVVNGFNTRIKFFAVPNDNPEHLVKSCFSEIWEQPSGPGVFKKHFLNVSCVIDHHMLNRQIRTQLGGWVDQDPDDPTYQQLAKESLQKYVLDRVDKKPHRLLRVERVATQVVNGFNTRIKFFAVPNDNPEHLVKSCFSEIWEQPWGPGVFKKHINVSCVIDHHMLKRQVLGGLEDQNPDDPTYQQLAKESLQKFVLESVNKEPLTLLGVKKVTTQVVAGLMTRIDFLAVPTDNPSSLFIKCHSEIWEQPWLNKKDIDVTCETDNDRFKRHIIISRPGAPEEQDPNALIYQQLAEESLRKYDSERPGMKPHTLLRVERVFTQLVSGLITRIDFLAVPKDNPSSLFMKCHSEIWEQSWLNKKNIAVSCAIDNHRLMRQVQTVLGGLEDQNPDDPTYQQLAKESLQKFVLESVNKEPLTLLSVKKVTTQVVAGLMTRIDFLAVPTDNPSSLFIKCHSEIWEQPWLNKKDINVTCEIDNDRLI